MEDMLRHASGSSQRGLSIYHAVRSQLNPGPISDSQLPTIAPIEAALNRSVWVITQLERKGDVCALQRLGGDDP